MPGRVCVRRRRIVPIVIQPVARVALVALVAVAAAQRVHGMCWKTQKERRKNAERTQKEVERCISTVHCRTPLRLYAMYGLEMATIQLSLSVEVRDRLACHLSIVPRSDVDVSYKITQ